MITETDDKKPRFDFNYNIIVEFVIVVLIIADTFLLLLADFSDLSPSMVMNINYFDLSVCFVLFCEFMFRLKKAENKKLFFKDINNWIAILAMIPINFFAFRLLRYIKILPLLYRGSVHFNKFLKETHLNWSFGVLVTSISVGTVLFYIFEHGVNHHIHDLWDSFLYVMPTIGCLGAPVSPKTLGGEIMGVVLMLVGIISFGLFTASIASMYIKSDEEKANNEELNELKVSITNIENEIKKLEELIKRNN
jgi:hypothetical protein